MCVRVHFCSVLFMVYARFFFQCMKYNAEMHNISVTICSTIFFFSIEILILNFHDIIPYSMLLLVTIFILVHLYYLLLFRNSILITRLCEMCHALCIMNICMIPA